MCLMMSSSSFVISQEEFNLFHAIDRELYTLLVNDLWRDPLESMQIMALWLWLERSGFKNVVIKILSLPLILINEVADEAVACLNCINNTRFLVTSESSTEIPLTESLMEGEISLQFFHENRVNATHGLAKIVAEVCVRALTDIMQQAIAIQSQSMAAAGSLVLMPPAPHQSMVQPAGFSRMPPPTPRRRTTTTQAEKEVPADDRTMFVTFSKGYPVSEWEVREFFTRALGSCIESLHMQEVRPAEQSLFARIVFYSSSTLELILSGIEKVKFNINGKHVWARKFVPRRPQSLPGAF
uniref:Uncharacterized protein n=1 Tax=Davidia involucrata TaxID=16924 RepID=A0A5B7BWM9_DAVIN